MAAKKSGHGNTSAGNRVVAVAWYRREEWPRLLEVSADRDDLEETYDQWLRSARQVLLESEERGLMMQKVDVTVDELVRWSKEKKVPLDSAARADFAAWKVSKTRAE